MDRLKLIKFPQTAVFAVRSAIERSWVKGIQKEKEATGQTEIQFRGNPWSGQGDDACPALYMVCEVMASLYHLGWNLVMCTDISKRAVSSTSMWSHRLLQLMHVSSSTRILWSIDWEISLRHAPSWRYPLTKVTGSAWSKRQMT
jgi:hypothetical protein